MMPYVNSDLSQSDSRSNATAGKKAEHRKRKPVIDSDSDLESSMIGFDFGDLGHSEVAARSIKRSRSRSLTNGKAASCIVIDDSDNDDGDDDFVNDNHSKKSSTGKSKKSKVSKPKKQFSSSHRAQEKLTSKKTENVEDCNIDNDG